MKLIFFVAISLLLSYFGADANAFGVDAELEKAFVRETIGYPRESIQKRVQEDSLLGWIARFFGKDFRKPVDGDAKTKLTDLDMDCVFLILKQLDYADLLAVAEINDPFSIVAAAVFRRRFSHLFVEVRDAFELPEKKSFNLRDLFERFKPKVADYVFVSDSTVLLDKYSTVVNSFKYFGYVIKKLKISTSSTFWYSNEEFIGNLISEYTSDSLIDVIFEHSSDILLAHITKPLANVETARFEGIYFSEVPRGLALNELLPAVRTLELVSMAGAGLGYFDCRMPNLEHLYLFKGNYLNVDYLSLISISNLIMNNPQIRSIELNGNHPELLQRIIEHLPQLESLTLSKFGELDGSYRFENVTTLTLHDGVPSNLHFPRLCTLYLDCNSYHLPKYLEFFNEHNHFSHLHLMRVELSDSEFEQLTASATNLIELTIERLTYGNDLLTSNAISQFLRNNHHVMRLNVIDFTDHWNAELQEQTMNEWNCKTVDRGMFFERKTNN